MESIMNWIGGKSQSAEKIVSLMPEHKCYVELFFGAGWVYFKKSPTKDETINDINSELINFYRVLQRQPDRFKEREKYELYSSDLYYEYMNDFNSGKHHTLNDVEKAFRFFCLIREAFGSKFGSGFAFGCNRRSAIAFFNEFQIIDDITKRLKNTTIDNRDFEEIIKSYDSEETLYYADPPYIKSDNIQYYFKSSNNSFTLYDHQRLFNALKSIKGKCILTIDNSSWVRERYTKENGFYLIENEVFYCSSDKNNRRHETELIILNYNPEKMNKHIDYRQGKLQF